MTNENDQFVRVPMWILKISHVNGHKFNDGLKNLYCYLKGWERAFPSYAKIGSVFGITPRAAEERIKKLVEMGLIEKRSRFATSNEYTVLDVPGVNISTEEPVAASDDVQEIVIPKQAPESEKATAYYTASPMPITYDNRELRKISDWIASSFDLTGNKGMENFIEYASTVAIELNFKLPPGIEDYFEEHYPEYYKVFDPIPF